MDFDHCHRHFLLSSPIDLDALSSVYLFPSVNVACFLTLILMERNATAFFFFLSIGYRLDGAVIYHRGKDGDVFMLLKVYPSVKLSLVALAAMHLVSYPIG